MQNLINIETKNINGALIQTVNARDLHAFLEIKSRFNDWIKNRIREYNFIENLGFITLTKNLVGDGSRVDYHISLDMAKELSMVERNEKGKQARQYFIDEVLIDGLKLFVTQSTTSFAQAYKIPEMA